MAPKRKTTAEFIKEAKIIHGDKYDYSKSVYVRNCDKLIIICSVHGDFLQTASDHLKGRRCIKCSRKSHGENSRFSNSEFIKRSIVKHGDKYSYIKTDYKTTRAKVIITCLVHGDFKQVASTHLNGSGCQECGKEIRIQKRTVTTDEFIKRSSAIHDNKYDYSLAEYTKGSEKVKIKCHVHGVFEQIAASHLVGGGCLKCGFEVIAEARRLTTNDFIRKATITHGDRYDYSLIDYKSANELVKIICRIHGEFKQKASRHILGQGCQKCGFESANKKKTISNADFIKRSSLIHDDKYDYSLTDYTHSFSKVKIICPIHGIFNQDGAIHLLGSGCSKCGKCGYSPGKPGYVYILRSSISNIVKIGVTNNIDQRIKTLTRVTPFNFNMIECFKFVDGRTSIMIEKTAHLMGVSCGLSGFDGATEWFKFDSNIIDWIKSKHGIISR